MASFRSIYRWLLPGWLSRDDTDGGKIAYSLSLMCDAMITIMREGMSARFPSYAGASALALHALARGIGRGRDETDSHFARRLIGWRYPRGHRVRGSAFALLEQISEYFGGIRCWSIDRRGNRHVRDTDGAESYSYGYAWDWDGVALSPRWARFWLVLEPVPELDVSAWPPLGDPACWDGSLEPGRGLTLGHRGISYQDAKAIKALMTQNGYSRPWKPAGTRCEWAVIVLDDHNTADPPEPDGTWDDPRNRDSAYRYWYIHR